MIDYNKSRKEQQVDKLQEDFIVWAESQAAKLEIGEEGMFRHRDFTTCRNPFRPSRDKLAGLSSRLRTFGQAGPAADADLPTHPDRPQPMNHSDWTATKFIIFVKAPNSSIKTLECL